MLECITALCIQEFNSYIGLLKLFQNRSDFQCQHRWQKVLNPELIKGPWTKEEDQRVTKPNILLFNKIGT